MGKVPENFALKLTLSILLRKRCEFHKKAILSPRMITINYNFYAKRDFENKTTLSNGNSRKKNYKILL